MALRRPRVGSGLRPLGFKYGWRSIGLGLPQLCSGSHSGRLGIASVSIGLWCFVFYRLVWACFGSAGDRAWVGLELSWVGLGVSLVVLCVGLGLNSRCFRLGSCRFEIL